MTDITWATRAPGGGYHISRRREGEPNIERVWLKSLICGYCDKEVKIADIGAQLDNLHDLDESVAEPTCPKCQEAVGP